MNKRIIMMDYAGGHSPNAGLRGEIYGPDRIADLMRLFRDVGFDTVWFRTSYCGTVCYHSKVMKPFEGEYRLFCNVLARAMAEFDPLEVAVREGHRCGLKVLAWITPFDNYFPGLEDPFLARHPEWLLTSRDGRYAMRGVPCLAYTDYTDRRLAEVREVMEFGCDGVYHSWATHTVCTAVEGDPQVENGFGWNPPILEKYHGQFGRPGVGSDYDYHRIAEIHADFLDEFVRGAGQIVGSMGGEYVTTNCSGVLTTDEYSWYTYTPGGAKVFRLPAHWRKWVAQKWIHRLAVGADGPWLAENEKIMPLSVSAIGLMHAAWGDDPQYSAGSLGEIDRIRCCLSSPFGAVALQESDTIEAANPALWNELKQLFGG